MGKNQAVKPLLAFAFGTTVLTFIFQYLILAEAKTIRTLWVVPLMWTPGLVALACSNYFNFGFRDLAMIRPLKKSMIYAYVVPLGAAVLTLALLVLIDIGDLKSPDQGWVKVLLIETTLGVMASFFLAFGEELGWRGYLHSHLVRAGFSNTILITGAVWAVWHWPLIIFGDYATSTLPLLSLMLFTIQCISFSVFLGWLREYSRSVFPAALAHAAHNSFIQGVYPSFYKPGRLDPFFGGESGFILAIIYLLGAIFIYRKSRLLVQR